jgi:hypothetical protein
MPLLTKEQILARKGELPRETLPVPELGGDVIVRALSAKERDDYEASSLRRKGNRFEQNLANVRARLVVRAVLNEDGSRMFTDDDADSLGEIIGSAIDRIYDKAAKLSGITKDDAEELARPNFVTGPGASGATASPAS